MSLYFLQWLQLFALKQTSSPLSHSWPRFTKAYWTSYFLRHDWSWRQWRIEPWRDSHRACP